MRAIVQRFEPAVPSSGDVLGGNQRAYIAHHPGMLPGQPNALFTDAAIEIIHDYNPGYSSQGSTMSAWHLCWLGLQRENG